MCEKLVSLCGVEDPAVVESLEALLSYVPRDEIASFNHYVCLAAGNALGEEGLDAQQLVTKLMNGQFSEAQQASMVQAASAVLEKLGWEYTEKGIYFVMNNMLGDSVMASIGCNDGVVSSDVKHVAITVLEDVVGEKTSVLMTLQDIQSGRISPELRVELTNK